MKDLVDELRELGERAETSSGELHLRPEAVRRIRLRQFATVTFAAVLIAGLAGVSVKAFQWAAESPAAPARPNAEPVRAGPISVTISSETYTLSAVEDSQGTEIQITQSSEPDVGTLGHLPLPEKVNAVEFVDPLETGDWGILGLVPSEAAEVLIVFDDGRRIEATLYALPEIASSVKAFAAEESGMLVPPARVLPAHEIRVLDSSGEVIATERRDSNHLVDPSPTS
jgi:hypothetical protein